MHGSDLISRWRRHARKAHLPICLIKAPTLSRDQWAGEGKQNGGQMRRLALKRRALVSRRCSLKETQGDLTDKEAPLLYDAFLLLLLLSK